jgi:RHS repeat-associated protein
VNTVRESYRYDAFGLPTVTVGAGQQPIDNRFLFTGREWNPTFGFYEYRARAYNPTLGRFMSEDPKGFDAGDYNLYRYCANDPLDKTDPMGLGSVIIAFPDYMVQTDTIFGRQPLGHAGLLTINNSTGAAHYYEYGRYDAQQKGIVRDYVPKTQIKLNKDGSVDRNSVRNAMGEISHRSGQDGRAEGAYVPTTRAQEDKINAYAKGRKAQNTDSDRKSYDKSCNSCNDFPRDAVSAGGISVPSKDSIFPAKEIHNLQKVFEPIQARSE